MPWVRFDERFPTHRKVRRLSDAAFRLHVSAIHWCSEHLTDGHVPADDLSLVSDVKRPAKPAGELEQAGLWEIEPTGWLIHDYLEYQPSAERVRADRQAKTARQQRWRQGRGSDVDASTDAHVDASTDTSRDTSRDATPYARPRVGTGRGTCSPDSSTSVGGYVVSAKDADVPRDDVQRLCDHLADRIRANGSKRPKIGKGWRDAARLMLDRDGRTEAQVHSAIDWCQDDEFWRANVLSMPTLREKYDQLRLQAQRSRASPNGAPSPGDQRIAALQALKTPHQPALPGGDP